ncbi:ATP-binding SpoIIE family protein phosphatase [Streptomyces europaeiscabiei]|uniref:ATP-binding SpoIIE family protein phosphatase n=1 Tax=Streptomyces europaeiscabiei TaxID=146819 RepID=UPI0029AE5A1B|nr:ATP-binding SpoIIE family protein phosphatase [Streptomyces europaeiscabiei]MDX3580587.1 SpoIIE family protein phosphatase [Streptomyces europaeiscabiei]MDX3637310.1 SpoIIE family protein phosphatase [Streptomyces europaeiscabiei]MDX3655319.1 SpoIIE family protein phosphatase [Streptomyces europaeiscabiei]
MGAIPTQRDIVSCASDTPARVGSESLYAATAYAGLDRRAAAHLSLPSGPLAPGAARRFVGAALAEWAELDLPGAAALSARLVEDVLVVVSELVTNAVVHAGTDVELLCRLGRDVPAAAGWLLVEVSDHHPSKTVRDEGAERPYLVERPYGAAEYGRGLRLVAALSEAWGITYRTGVKTVWARLSVDGAMAVEGTFEAYGGDEGGAGGEGGSGAAGSEGTEEVQEVQEVHKVQEVRGIQGVQEIQGGESWDARAYAGAAEAPALEGARAYADYSGYAGEAGPGLGVGPVDLVAPTPRRGVEHDREWLNRGALSFLAEASDLLAGQLDEDLVAALAGQLLVPRLADWCAVWLEEEGLGWRGGDGSLGPAPRLARVWHGSENRIEELRRALEKDPPRLPESVRSRAVPVPWPHTGSGIEATDEGTESGSGTGTASGSGAPRGQGGPVEEGQGGAAEAGESEVVEAGEGGAALAYRLIAGGRPLGTLVIGRAGLLRFPDEVTGLVEDLSRRIALSIGAARQYARQATISRVLQRGLLPGAVAEIPGVSSALVYEPCDKGGPSGDFYDLFPAGRGRWGFAIGDVQGKGPEAAVVIGLARPWLRLLAREGYGVADVLDRLNQLLLDDATEAADAAARALVTAGDPGLVDPEGPQTRFLSLLYGELVPVEGGVRCTLASAGHPLPLLLGPGGDVRAVAEPQTLLGVIEDTEYISETFELRCGDTLLCVTDGVTERRNGPHMFDDGDGLAAVLSDCAGLDAQLIAERIRRLVHEFGERPPDDDLALLVLQAE